MTKQELRALMRERKRGYSQQQLEALSLPIIHKVLCHPHILAASDVLLYHSLPDEVCTHALIDTLLGRGKRIILPKVISETEMTLHPYATHEDLTAGSFGILEPNTPEIPLSRISGLTAIIPGMAFDPQGYRLGRGKGYYDRLLQHIDAYRIGLCFPFQLVDSVPHNGYDIVMNEVIFS